MSLNRSIIIIFLKVYNSDYFDIFYVIMKIFKKKSILERYKDQINSVQNEIITDDFIHDYLLQKGSGK